MEKNIVDRFMQTKVRLAARFADRHPAHYRDLFTTLIDVLNAEYEDTLFEMDSIAQVSFGDGCQGMLAFFVAAYDEEGFYATKVAYGSCSSCDTLKRIREAEGWYDEDGEDAEVGAPTEQQVAEYVTLCLHLVQRMKQI